MFRAAVSYTLDDGQPSQVEHYEELQATGVRMTFYVSSETASGSAAFWRRVLADGHELGNHTVHHCRASFGEDPVLSSCAFGSMPAAATADSEIDDVSAFLTGPVGQAGCGRWPRRTATPLGRAGKFLRVRVDGGTLSQGGVAVPWDDHGFYEVALDAGELTLN